MKLIILASILSITLHILFFLSYNKIEEKVKDSPSSSKKIDKTSKSKVKYVKLLPKIKNIQKNEKVKKEEIKPTPKEIKTFKKVEKEKIIPQKKKLEKKTKKTTPKPIQKLEVPLIPTKPVEIKPQRKRQTIPKKSLENFLLSEPEPLDINLLDNITQSYLKLYDKEDYNSFTKVQKVFLQNNLKDIGKITQKYLTYPNIAIQTRQHGMNIAEFYLYPNGDISSLKLIKSSGYNSLDKNSIETIEIAYKDYPRPKTKTKIRIYVFYNLY